MFKDPKDYTKEDISEIMNIPIILDIGKINSDEINKSVEGIIVNCTLDIFSPHLPTIVNLKTSGGEIKSFNLYKIKKIRSL